ncbi:MAG TPA: hypothetical protein ENN29_06420 [Candidatus Hydrogenedentes bacterium]|nr:hypothetical protein [Candidatus Hydrogenedentota bacterium]
MIFFERLHRDDSLGNTSNHPGYDPGENGIPQPIAGAAFSFSYQKNVIQITNAPFFRYASQEQKMRLPELGIPLQQ